MVRIRYKQLGGAVSSKLEFPVSGTAARFDGATEDMRFAASVAAFGMLLRDSEFRGASKFEDVLRWSKAAVGEDAEGYRAEFLQMVRRAHDLKALQ